MTVGDVRVPSLSQQNPVAERNTKVEDAHFGKFMSRAASGARQSAKADVKKTEPSAEPRKFEGRAEQPKPEKTMSTAKPAAKQQTAEQEEITRTVEEAKGTAQNELSTKKEEKPESQNEDAVVAMVPEMLKAVTESEVEMPNADGVAEEMAVEKTGGSAEQIDNLILKMSAGYVEQKTVDQEGTNLKGMKPEQMLELIGAAEQKAPEEGIEILVKPNGEGAELSKEEGAELLGLIEKTADEESAEAAPKEVKFETAEAKPEKAGEEQKVEIKIENTQNPEKPKTETKQGESKNDFAGMFANGSEKSEAVQHHDAMMRAERPMIARQVTEAVIKADVKLLSGEAMEIKLTPDHLGKVSMKVEVHEGNLTANIKVENAEVKAAIEASIHELRQALEQKGVDVKAVNVSVNTDDHRGGQQYTGKEADGKDEDDKAAQFKLKLDEVAEAIGEA